MPFTIVRQDITRMHVDAIVNAANKELRMGGGVCGAIFRAAGERKLQDACNKVSPIQTGEAVITPGFQLPAKYVIHTAGPIYAQWSKEQNRELLRSAYIKSLEIAVENGCESIAFPLISSGIYGYPKDEALSVATEAITDFIMTHDMDVYLAVFGHDAFIASTQLLGKVESFIDENYVNEHTTPRRVLLNFEQKILGNGLMEMKRDVEEDREMEPDLDSHYALDRKLSAPLDLSSMMESLDEPFNITLFRLIDAKGLTDTEVYKKANINRKLFSKIRTGKGYTPSKKTILALAIALELNLQETDDLLKRAGYALSHSQKFDVIVEFFILEKKYNIFEINEVLFHYDQPLLGAK